MSLERRGIILSSILKVTPLENYTLEIELDNHHKIIYQMP